MFVTKILLSTDLYGNNLGNVDRGVFSTDTISVQQVYLVWDDTITAHTPAVLHSPQDDDWGDEWPGLYKSSCVQ